MNHCPQCRHRIETGSSECDWCGFSMRELDRLCGGDDVLMSRLEDDLHYLRSPERAELMEAVERFEHRFPQLFLAFFVGPIPAEVDARLFGTWLLNRAEVELAEDQPVRTDREHCAMFVIDPRREEVGLSLGYFLESLVSDDEARQLLQTDPESLAARDFAGFLIERVGMLENLLKNRHREAGRRSP